MNEALQALEIKVENGGATPQGKFFAKDWNTLVEAVKQLDLAEFDEAALNKYLKDNGYITSDDIPSTDLSDLVTLSTEQTIPGAKNFTGGIKVNGQPLIYNAELGVWELTGDLLVTGNVAWFASIKGFKPSTIMDAVQVDGETIVKNELGQLKVIGGGSGGSGGGLTISDLSNYLTTNKYTKQSDVEALISTALTAAIPTNNNQLSNGAGYITAAALAGYATQSWVESKKYLTGITSSQVTTALGYTPYNSSNPDKYIKGIDYDMVIAALGYTPYSTTNPMGYLTISSLLGYATEQWVGDNYLAKSGGDVNGNVNLLGVLNIIAGSIRDDSWIQFTANGTTDSYALGIRWPFESYGLQFRQNNDYYNILHSGNIGSYKAGSAYDSDKLGGFSPDGYGRWLANAFLDIDLNTIRNGFRAGKIFGAQNAPNEGASYRGFLEYGYNGYVAQFSSDEYDLYYRWCDGSTWRAWRQFAFTDSNVASATKLQTARIIWGQSFDGTADISGTIKNVDVIRNARSNWIIGEASLDGEVHIGSASFAQARTLYNANGMLSLLANGTFRLLRREDTPPLMHSILTYEAAPYGLLTRINTDGSVSLQAQREANDAECFRLLLNPLGGNVAIGRPDASAKLHVGGDVFSDGVYKSAQDFIMLRVNASIYSQAIMYFTEAQSYIEAPNGSPFYIGWRGGSALLSFDASKNATINGNLLVNGNVSWITQSQRSLKDITSEQGLSLAQLERIKPIKFYWKDGRDAALHVGGVADVFAEVLPEVVSHWKNTLCLNYVDASFYTAASLIAPVLDHDRRIAQLERENAELKQKLNQLAA